MNFRIKSLSETSTAHQRGRAGREVSRALARLPSSSRSEGDLHTVRHVDRLTTTTLPFLSGTPYLRRVGFEALNAPGHRWLASRRATRIKRETADGISVFEALRCLLDPRRSTLAWSVTTAEAKAGDRRGVKQKTRPPCGDRVRRVVTASFPVCY